MGRFFIWSVVGRRSSVFGLVDEGGGRWFASNVVGGRFLFSKMIGGRWSVVGGCWSVAGGWSMAGGFVPLPKTDKCGEVPVRNNAVNHR